MYINRDMGINHIKTRPMGICSGMGLGIMVMDQFYPGFPGDVRNASAYPFPVQFEAIEGLEIDPLLYGEDKDQFIPIILKAAKRLERIGCRAIAAECGYFAYYQKIVADEMDIPVFMSSLLQVPLIQRTISSKKKVGIVCANKNELSNTHLQNVGVSINSNYFVEGIHDFVECVQFKNLWGSPTHPILGEAYFDLAEREIVQMALSMKERHPEMGALMLECTGWQPFARTIQKAIDLPVYSWGTLLDYAYSVVVHRDYYGHV
ncbi:MAG: aspartate/glutamate racemase family protein [Tissierellales bacterium]|nr:aspartate/glutamate racemase family protein [Tissierellales bacterium]MBN2827557.1 aspartate/glutamate racemase family protein [Tissierellales bacterium]